MDTATQTEPIRIGLFVGREWSWPPAFIEEVNKSRDPKWGYR
jgi:hypothetical protein